MLKADHQEYQIREAVRREYREQGQAPCPYEKGSLERLIWLDECHKIFLEYLISR